MRRKISLKTVIKVDKKLFFVTILLTFLGLIAIADASAPLAIQKFSDKFYYVKQQFVWATLGLILMLIFSKIPYRFWEKIATPLFFGSLAGLIMIFVPGVGEKILGARRWIYLGLFSFQPSELVKLTLAVYIAKVASKEKRTMAFFAPLIISAFLVMLQPDLGTTMVIVLTTLTQIFVSGINMFYFLGAGVFGALITMVTILTSQYRKDRLMTFLSTFEDPLNKGYHIRQILLALGSGGFWGVGLGMSRQKYLFLPETATDSIFAIIAEEIGFIGSSALILLFAYYIWRGIGIAKGAPDKFSSILAIGLVSWIGIQTFLNIASMVALVPLTGIPLPFFSYGGTALVMTLIATGILLNISSYVENKHKK